MRADLDTVSHYTRRPLSSASNGLGLAPDTLFVSLRAHAPTRCEFLRHRFSKRMHPRNGVEGTHSELVRGHAMRRTKYRGLSRVRLSHYFMGAACNVKRYLNLLAFQIKTAAPSPA